MLKKNEICCGQLGSLTTRNGLDGTGGIRQQRVV
jgi:hypothetical protein